MVEIADMPGSDRPSDVLASQPVRAIASMEGRDADGRRILRKDELPAQLLEMLAASATPLRKGVNLSLELSVEGPRGCHAQRRRFVIGGE